VRKFVVTDSVEERIVELQNRKQYMADEMYSEDSNMDDTAGRMGSGRLGMEEFRLIFER
jgi:SNF2 family DNA or RNA helicase